MAKTRQENLIRPAIKTDDRDEDTFSFAAVAVQDKLMDDQAHDQGLAANTDSPADFLFANGQLLPHAFPVLLDSSRKSISKDSLTSSSSKGSTASSRSSSTGRNSLQNSESKGSDGERVMMGPTSAAGQVKPVIKHVRFRSCDDATVKPPKGQFMTGPPGRRSTAEVSRRKKVDAMEKKKDYRKRPMAKSQASGSSSAGRGIFRSFMAACRECHALEPSMQIERPPPGKWAYSTRSQTDADCVRSLVGP